VEACNACGSQINLVLAGRWNAALVLCARSIANILAAGCTVVMKASELCPWTHQFIMETFMEAGFPPGAVNMVMADRATGPAITETIIAHPAIRKVEFIGSAPVGRIIGQVCAKHLKPIFMELGDQSPAIVMEDADLQKAAQMCAQGAMAHQGQVCFSTERIIVMKQVQDEFSKLLVAALDGMGKLGGPARTSVTKAAAEKAKGPIDAAVKEGAKFLYGSTDMGAPSSMGPSILTDVDRNSAVSSAEAFAPTAFVMAVDTEEEAIEEANSRIGGLSASVFTRSYERGLRMARQLEFGEYTDLRVETWS
jgi:acyl-CoA reductase-like NAD-dependent aldehyde dehydrogenase